MEVLRPFLTVHVFGGKQTGKTTVKTQWFDSSQCHALSEVADVHIRLQGDCSYAVMDSIRDRAGLDGARHTSFLILYRSDQQESMDYGQSVLEKVYTTFDYSSQVNVTFLENHFEPDYQPQVEEPTQFPLSPSVSEVLASRNPPQLWRARVTDSVQMSPLLDSLVVQPLLHMFDHSTKEKCLYGACVSGLVQAVKLLVGTLTGVDLSQLLLWTTASLDKHLAQQATPSTSPPSPDLTLGGPSFKAPLEEKLMSVARYIYNLDMSASQLVLVKSAETYPRATLYLLQAFQSGKKQDGRKSNFQMSRAGLTSVPVSWIDHTHLTHIGLNHNALTMVPTELFQLPQLYRLNLSHNCLEAIPDILKWNSPRLKDLDLSHNRLLSKQYSILEGRRIAREPNLDAHLPSIGKQRNMLSAAQAVQSLTGYNLYPCICSLSRVSISHNATLDQVPEWVCVLPSLTLFEMKGLPRLTRLTPHLSHCRSLCVLSLDCDHLLSPPPDLAHLGTRNILAYLRCQLRGSTPYRHIKLVLVGEKGVGKTTLFNQFVKGSGRSNPSSPTMDMATFDYPSRFMARKDRPRITFHVIDFAGDEIYRCTHNCFLTYRTIYLCMWNTAEGKDSLQRLCPWLHSIQASVPGSPVLLVASHVDRRPGLSAETILKWEEEVLGKPVMLRNRTTARGLGFPPIMQSVVMDCLNREDVDMLLGDIYKIAQQMRHPKTNVLLMSEPFPRSYQELQTLVEVKVRNLCLERHVPPVVRHEELIDYVRSLTVANPNGLDQGEEEFNLACRFLNEAGAIVHFKSQQSGVSDLYFLDPQWLFNALASVIRGIKQGRQSAVVQGGEWPHYFQSIRLPQAMYRSFLCMLEYYNIIVSLDFTKDTYMVPSLLPDTPPPNYPTYDLSSNLGDVVVQYLEVNFLPPPLFPQLIARVLLYIRQISAQLLSTSMEPEREGLGAGSIQSNRSSMISKLSMYRSESYHLDQLGYLSHDDLNMAGHDDVQRLRKIWGLSTASLASQASPSTRHRQLTEKLVAIAQPMLQTQQFTSSSTMYEPDTTSSSSHGDEFASYLFWNKGLFCEFPCGTKFWLEACTSALAIVIRGSLLPRVKVLSFLTSSIDALVDECYSGTHVASYSPCPKCLASFWATTTSGESQDSFAPTRSATMSNGHVSSSLEDAFPLRSATFSPGGVKGDTSSSPDLLRNNSNSATNVGGISNSPVDSNGSEMNLVDMTVSMLEQSHEVSMNEFSETILYLRKKKPSSPGRALSFSGSNFTLRHLSPYSSPAPDDSTLSSPIREDERPDVAFLDSRLTLFSLETTVQQAVMSSSIPCPSCESRISLETISPHVMLVDFKNSFLLKAKDMQFTEDAESTLGKGGFGKVFKGTYKGEDVAVKVFRKGYHENVLLRRYKDLREELTIMSQLQHPRVVALVGVCLRPLAMVLKLAPLGTLRNHIDLCPHGMKSEVAHAVLYQIADGIRYLHSLYIVHRDIKPSNVLVWDLQPDYTSDHTPLRGRGVDVKLADYGVSQFYSPSGLRRHKGTEEYMAPELFRDNRKIVYDAKVDIFSFGLVLHAVVTGRRLFANIMNKREQLRLLYQADFPQLSAALADALNDSSSHSQATPPSPKYHPVLDEQGRHRSARTDVITSCHSVCMQPLMQSCLANKPEDRPSAQGLCGSLLLCPGSTPQRDYYIAHHIISASFCSSEHLVVGLQADRLDYVVLFPTATWQMRCVATPYIGERFVCLHVARQEVFLASQESRLLYSFLLPGLQSGHILAEPLEATPTCIFSFEGIHGINIAVGMSGSRLAMFSSPSTTEKWGGGHLLETPPLLRQVMVHPDASKMDITCGTFHDRTLWCGCGQYLVGVHPQDLLMKHYSRLIKEDVTVACIAAAQKHLWISFRGRSLLMVATTTRPGAPQTIDCHSVLGHSTVREDSAAVTDVRAGTGVVWAATQGGHLLGFHPLTADVLVVHHKASSLRLVLPLSERRLITFGCGILGAEEEEEESRTAANFTIWDSYTTNAIP